MEVITLEDVYYCQKGALSKGTVKIAESGVGIKTEGSQGVIAIKRADIKELSEHHGVMLHVLKITQRDGKVHIIDGISVDTLETVREYAKKHYKLNLYHKEFQPDGHVHGRVEVGSTCVEMKSRDKTVFEIPLDAISNAYERRGEGIIDIKEDYHGVTEIRFGSKEENSNVQSVIEQIRMSIREGSQTEVLSVEEVACLLPRGKSKLTLTSRGIHVIGKTYSHQIVFEAIARMFLLERSPEEGEGEMFYLVLELTTPVRQGQTRYHFVSILLPTDRVVITPGKYSKIEYADEEEGADGSNSDGAGAGGANSYEENRKRQKQEPESPPREKKSAESKEEPENRNGKKESEEAKKEDLLKMKELGVEPRYEGPLANCLVEILEALSHVSPIRTGSFVGSAGGRSLKCSTKANEGYLYPLKKGLLFLPKIAYIEYEKIKVVEFSRVHLSTRTAKTFDVRVSLEDRKEHMFNGIQKTEFSALETYLTGKDVKCRSEVVSEEWEREKVSENEGSEDEATASEETTSEETDGSGEKDAGSSDEE